MRTLYWSHLDAYEECPQKYLWSYGWGDIDLGRGPGKGKPRPKESKHHPLMGIVIQSVLEDFYNKEMWADPTLRGPQLRRQLIELTKDKYTSALTKFYIDWDKISFEEMEKTCINGVLGFLPTMRHHKLLGIYARSEVELSGKITNWLPVGGRADFVIRREDTGVTLLDGKNSNTKMKYVKPDQLRWYALCFYLSYHKLPDRIGFLWFRYPYDEDTGETGIDWVDFTQRDLRELADRAKKARRGMEKEKFDPTPKAKVCRFCDFENECDARMQNKAANRAKRGGSKSLPVVSDMGLDGLVEFGFDDISSKKE